MSVNNVVVRRGGELVDAKDQLEKVIRRDYEVTTHVYHSFSISDAAGLGSLRSLIKEALGAICSHGPKSNGDIEKLIYRQIHNSDPLMTFDYSSDELMFFEAFGLLNSLNEIDRAIKGFKNDFPAGRDEANELEILWRASFETLAIDQYDFPDTWPWHSTND